MSTLIKSARAFNIESIQMPPPPDPLSRFEDWKGRGVSPDFFRLYIT